MSKPEYNRSVLTLTFAVEALEDSDEDCPEGWIDLEQPVQGCKLSYSLCPEGKNYEIEVLIWPNIAKVVCNGLDSCFVRTWFYQGRKFLAFSIRHLTTVRVHDLFSFTAIVTPSFGINSISNSLRNEKTEPVYVFPLPFGVQRYFGQVKVEIQESFLEYIDKLIWETVVNHIPASYLDGTFECPQPVTDVRHQDTLIYNIQKLLLAGNDNISSDQSDLSGSRKSTVKKKPLEASKSIRFVKYECQLRGEEMLAGAGRIVKFKNIGERTSDSGDVIVLLSSNNLPADDDNPIVFVNVNELMQIPAGSFKKLRITNLYTRWSLGNVTHDSEPRPIRKDVCDIDDHYALPIEFDVGSEILASFWDNPFKIELRGIRTIADEDLTPMLYGHLYQDRYISKPIYGRLNTFDKETDVPLAICTIDLRSLAKGMNGLVRGEYCVNPLPIETPQLNREEVCTNDINAIRRRVPELAVPNSLILEAQMTLDIEIGLVGCKMPKLSKSFSRLFCITSDTDSVSKIFMQVTKLNDSIAFLKQREKLLTGFAIDVGNKVLMFLEGPRDGNILHVWEQCIDYYSTIKPVFNTSSRFISRFYPELESAAVPFIIMKMYASLSSILACPSVYIKPAAPLPAIKALTKLGRLFSKKLTDQPSRLDMPTFKDLRSFRLEFCTPPKPFPAIEVIPYSMVQDQEEDKHATRVGKVVWDH